MRPEVTSGRSAREVLVDVETLRQFDQRLFALDRGLMLLLRGKSIDPGC